MTRNEKFFINQAFYWSKKLGIRLDYVNSDFSGFFYAQAELTDKGYHILHYNQSMLRHDRKYHMMRIIFHELGHFKNHNFASFYPYDYFTNMMIAEHVAESFAFECLKKYYPKYYKQLCKYIVRSRAWKLRNEETIEKAEFYFHAFSQIPEWQRVL